MKFEPGSFYFGVVDFFAIMLPGGLMAFFLYGSCGMEVFGKLMPTIPNDTGAGWVIFLFAAYLLGHIVFMIGSAVDPLHDGLLSFVRNKGWLGKDHLFRQADAMRKSKLGEEKKESMNTFQWTKLVLTLSCPQAMAEVARLEADSKFFRSLMVVLVFLFISATTTQNNTPALITIGLGVLLILSYLRYSERRRKSVEQACRYVIVLDGPKIPGG